eukprot:TRINITY_DN104128_c0_g1_i1.p1 TRINITY_DN104128_c0_g1~~TRINITY_DN104128_c0_g1_i1.p1  ORF type:complete len:346 (+),score=90.32 TRINITY_DN104128_c0_g1_i1:65-1102(+)
MQFQAVLFLLSLTFVSEASKMTYRKPPGASFLEAPMGTTHGLFIPAVHKCNETHLKEYLKKYPEQGLHSESRSRIERSLGIVHDVLAENSLPTILEGGSTLGFFRNCGVIPGDHDGDIALLGQWLDTDVISNLKKSFEKRNASLGDSLCPSGPGHSGCELRASFEDDSYVDLLVYASEEKCEKAPCNYYSSLWSGGSTDEGYFYPCDTGPIHFEQASFLDRTFWVQAPVLDYLKGQYGEVWEDPTGGVYKSCHFDQHRTPGPDNHGGKTPPADYVFRLQKESEAAMRSAASAAAAAASSLAEVEKHNAAAAVEPRADERLASGKKETVELMSHGFMSRRQRHKKA